MDHPEAKRLALQLVCQLPADSGEAMRVLDYAGALVSALDGLEPPIRPMRRGDLLVLARGETRSDAEVPSGPRGKSSLR